MGLTVWYFVIDREGDLSRVPAARWYRLCEGKARITERAGEELKTLEVVLDVDRRVVQRVVRVLPFRMPVNPAGSFDRATHWHLAMERLGVGFDPTKTPTDSDVIRQLELDASYFWEPDAGHCAALARAVQVDVEDIARAMRRHVD